MGITHGVFLLRICKESFNGLLAFGIERILFRRVPGVVRQLFVVLPNVPPDFFIAVLGLGTQMPGGTLKATAKDSKTKIASKP